MPDTDPPSPSGRPTAVPQADPVRDPEAAVARAKVLMGLLGEDDGPTKLGRFTLLERVAEGLHPAPSPTTPTRCTDAAMHGSSIEPSSSTGVTSSSSTFPASPTAPSHTTPGRSADRLPRLLDAELTVRSAWCDAHWMPPNPPRGQPSPRDWAWLTGLSFTACLTPVDELDESRPEVTLRSQDLDPVDAEIDEASAPNCGGILERPAVEVQWSELPSADASLDSASTLNIAFANQAGQELILQEIRVIGDAAGLLLLVDYPAFALQADERAVRSIALDKLGIDPSKMAAAGTLVVEARLVATDGSSMGTTATPAIYFHPAVNSSGFTVYGEEVLRADHGAGDFLGSLGDAGSSNPRRRRLMQGSLELPGGEQ